MFKTIAKNEYMVFLPLGIADVLYFGVINYNGKKHIHGNYWNLNMIFEESPA